MRATFAKLTLDALGQSEQLICLLGDIGVHSFREAMSRFPERVLNFGILEQTMVSFAAGLARQGYVPLVHSIAPFVVERALEQIKIDFGYQKLPGNIVSVGASFDYAGLGATHHAPGDVQALLTVPEIDILLPGHPDELAAQISGNYLNNRLSYFRLSEVSNSVPVLSENQMAKEIQRGKRATIVVVGPNLDNAISACTGLDVQIIYINSLLGSALESACDLGTSSNVLVIEPFYEGTMAPLFSAMLSSGYFVKYVGVPRAFLHKYGNRVEHVRAIGLDSDGLRNRIEDFLAQTK